MVELEVTVVYHVSVRSLDGHTDRVGDSVSYSEELDGHFADLHPVILLYDLEVDRVEMREFRLSLLDHEHSQVSRVHWWVADSVHDVWNTSDVVKVSVSDDDSSDSRFSFLEVLCVRKNIVNARSVFFGEAEPRVDNDDIVADFDRRHVHADFLNSSKRDDSDISRSYWRNVSAFGRSSAGIDKAFHRRFRPLHRAVSVHDASIAVSCRLCIRSCWP